MTEMESKPPTIVGRIRRASTSVTGVVINVNVQPGMWAATGTAIAYAPSLNELREPVSGGKNIIFNYHGQSARTVTTAAPAVPANTESLTLTRSAIKAPTVLEDTDKAVELSTFMTRATTSAEERGRTEAPKEKHNWKETTQHAFAVVWKFVRTPTGFFITIYGLNIVAWGAMLFFLFLDAAPAMNHPNKNDDSSPRKKWIEIDSQILNALFCVTGFGLAPWRFRDLYWMIQSRLRHNHHAMKRLCKQNESWFRPPRWYEGTELESGHKVEQRVTFTGNVAPPTHLWKLGFVVWMMVLNTLFQVVLSFMMWHYNRFNRPSWATGTFIGLGCAVSLFAGLMMWWEGRKVKKIEGPPVIVKAADSGSGNS